MELLPWSRERKPLRMPANFRSIPTILDRCMHRDPVSGASRSRSTAIVDAKVLASGKIKWAV